MRRTRAFWRACWTHGRCPKQMRLNSLPLNMSSTRWRKRPEQLTFMAALTVRVPTAVSLMISSALGLWWELWGPAKCTQQRGSCKPQATFTPLQDAACTTCSVWPQKPQCTYAHLCEKLCWRLSFSLHSMIGIPCGWYDLWILGK